MTDRAMNSSSQIQARITGLLYLIFMATLSFSMFIQSKFSVHGDTAVTARSILASEWLFRVGFMSEMVACVFFLLAAWALFVLLKPVNKSLALLFLLLNLGGVAAGCFNTLNQVAALLLLSGSNSLKVFPADQLQSLATLFLNLHTNGYTITQIFFGAWLFPLGYLVFKSGFLPRILGILLFIDGFAVLIWFFQFFLFPGYEVITYPCLAESLIAEFGLGLWLLIMGIKSSPLNYKNSNPGAA